MRIWIDAQLSPAVAAWINRTYEDIEAESVRSLGLRNALDHEIFQQARQQNVVIMSKDHDFLKLIEQHGPPPQIIWITCGNTSNDRMRQTFLSLFLKQKNFSKKEKPLLKSVISKSAG